MGFDTPQARLRPQKGPSATLQRNSHIVRASVLETALEIGFGQNSTVANWIFNNPLPEEAEDLQSQSDDPDQLGTKPDPDPTPHVAEVATPSLTSGSNSTSDESSSLNSPANGAPSAAITTIQVHSHKPSITEPPYVHFNDFPSDQLQLFSPFTASPRDAHHAGTRGSPVGKLPRDIERSRSQDDSLRHVHRHQSRNSPGPPDTGYTSEGQYLSKSKGKDKSGKTKGAKGSKSKTLDASKAVEKDGEYASDGGYLSASSNKSLRMSPGKVKARAMAFFRRRPKKLARASDDDDEDCIPPVPAIPVLPRPSSPKLLERTAASSPARPGFSPLTLNMTSPPASPPRRRISKSPPRAHASATTPQQSGPASVPQEPVSPLATSASAPTVLTPAAAAAAVTLPLPPSMPSTPLSTTSFSATSSPSASLAGPTKPLTTPSSRQHLGIPPPTPPPTLPLPQPPPPSPVGMLHRLPTTPATPSRKGAPTRPIPVVPMNATSTRPLTPRGAASPFRPLLSPRAVPTATRTGEASITSENDGRDVIGRQRSGTAGMGNAPAFLQRKIQASSPRHPPPDMPLPPSPCPTQGVPPHTPIGTPSKFHEHFSSISAPFSHILTPPKSKSPSLSTATLSGSSSGPSIRSSHLSSTSERSEDPVSRDRLNTMEYSRPATSTSSMSESSYGQPISSTFGRSFGKSALGPKSCFSDRSYVNLSVYSSMRHPDSGSITTLDDDDDDDADDAAPKSCFDDDDASVYPSDDQTAGRRTMYLLEQDEQDENGDEVVINGSRYWGGQEVPPPVPPLPPTRPGPGYF